MRNTSYLKVTIRITMGIALGLFCLFLVGRTYAQGEWRIANGAQCRKDFTYESLNESQQKALQRGENVYFFDEKKSGFVMAYVFSLSDYDTELVMATYSRFGDHAGAQGLGDYMIQSKVLPRKKTDPKNEFEVFYEQYATWPFSNSEYVYKNTIQSIPNGYEVDCQFVTSSDAAYSPRWAHGYFKAIQKGNRTFVEACHYMVPRTSWFQSQFNELVKARLQESAEHLSKWIKRVSQNSELENQYRETLRQILEPNP